MLWRRHHAQAQAARQAEGGKKEDAELRPRRHPARGVHRRAENGRRLAAPFNSATRWNSRRSLDVDVLETVPPREHASKKKLQSLRLRCCNVGAFVGYIVYSSRLNPDNFSIRCHK